MPIYEYELIDDDCLMCPGRFSAIQGIEDANLEHCPSCGLPCKRVVSQVSISMRQGLSASRAADKGFTTWKKVRAGEWEKVDGPGVDAIVGSKEDIAAVKEEKATGGKLDLDEID